METLFTQALVTGVERVAAWADLLDDINVFPVADGDTGRNLVVSLSPLRQTALGREKIIRELLLSARGNSGNIAARFFSGLLMADTIHKLSGAIRQGRDRAWQAVSDPKPGTMLTVFDVLVAAVEEPPTTYDAPWRERVIRKLEEAVLSTPDLLPKLKAAGVVDAGALGVFIYLEGFFNTLTGNGGSFRPITEIFGKYLKISPAFQESDETGCCVDMVLQVGGDDGETVKRLSAIGESVVVLRDGDYLKVHLHAPDGEKARGDLAAVGDVVRWSADDLDTQVRSFRRRRIDLPIHIMTDAAGSVNRENTAELGLTLLDSYINVGDKCLPETHFTPEELYAAMRRGVRASTSQASVFERHQYYQSLLQRYPRVLYLCVGSVFTGNYAVALEWKKTNDPEDRFTIIDTQAASGRLGILVVAAARFARESRNAEATIRFARESAAHCQEYVFLDKLHYLAAGGRLSRTSAFFGDVLHMKPVISPLAEGAKKMGVVRDQAGQLAFALEKLAAALGEDKKALIMLEYTDNAAWVEGTVLPEIARRHPAAEILLHPLSLTSGVHMGPGTWAVAFLPAQE
ncbi:MAG: DegV family EDD domain-containing protein [Deltaproteobacteria bacterium]|nr:MAG: DegV family EDD domain-containing protein [Deltaproteobacteria bacterium]